MILTLAFLAVFLYGLYEMLAWVDEQEDPERSARRVTRGALACAFGWLGSAVTAAVSVLHGW